jgi:hypothetical protein
MTRKRPASPEYAVSDEAAAYIADALMELALQFEATHFAQIRRHYNPSRPTTTTTTLGNSTCSAHIHPSERGSILWFDPRREHSSVPTAKSHSRRAQGLSRLAASFAATRRAWP